MANPIARHMNKFNKPSQVPNKRRMEVPSLRDVKEYMLDLLDEREDDEKEIRTDNQKEV